MIPRFILVSHRGPYRLRQTPQGVRRERSIGGLATSLLPLIEQLGGVWITSGESAGRYMMPPRKPRFTLRYLSLTPEQRQGFYYGLSNNALWPLCHSFLGRVRYDLGEWNLYEEVNRDFAEAALAEAVDGDIFWVHDYQLARVPHYIRGARDAARILFFWHIPFPPLEIYKTFPWRDLLLEGLLACDVVGFHVLSYVRNFMDAAEDILGAEHDGEWIHYNGRSTRVVARPIGIDYDAIERAAHLPQTDEQVKRLRDSVGEGVLIVGVERMDYTKGIVERLRGLEYLLERHPEWHGKVNLMQLVTPSRDAVEAYRQKKREIDEMVGRVNGRFSDGLWSPVHYQYRSFSPTELVAYYRAADIALVTPLRDGLNLVAKEYVASRINGDGALILSEFAGVADQLPEAVLTNPYSSEDVAAALQQALTMDTAEKRRRMAAMQARVKADDISWWLGEFTKLANG
jgi:alpha,alpha-trehalose-phosphate synthase [UDP-forming]